MSNNSPNIQPSEDWEFQWVEDSLKFTGYVFLCGVVGLASALAQTCQAAASAAQEKLKK